MPPNAARVILFVHYMCTSWHRKSTPMAVAKIDKALVAGMQPGNLYMDTQIKGFGVRCQGKNITFFYRYRNVSNTQRLYTLGDYGTEYNVTEAREAAKRVAGNVARHKDPDILAPDPFLNRSVGRFGGTIKDCAADYLEKHIAKGSINTYTAFKRYMDMTTKLWGNKKLGNVTPEDVAKAYQNMQATTPFAANRWYDAVRAMYNWEIKKNPNSTYKGANPCTMELGSRTHEPNKETFLNNEQVGLLLSSLDRHQQAGKVIPSICHCIRFLALTGLRKAEARTLRWDSVDLSNRTLNLRVKGTAGKIRTRKMRLNPQAASLLQRLYDDEYRDSAHPYVFPGDKEGKPVAGMHYAWANICKGAGLRGVRIHDLRHTFASQILNAGYSLKVVQVALDHKNIATTARYAHLEKGVLDDAVSAVGAIYSAASKG